MRLPLVLLFLLPLIRIVPGLSEELDLDPSLNCQLLLDNCFTNEACLLDACDYLRDVCRWRTSCQKLFYGCPKLVATCTRKWFKKGAVPLKKNAHARSSFLFMKLHPVLNRAIDPGLVNVPARFRRIGGWFGSEFLGKRSQPDGVGKRRRDATREGRRGGRGPGTELLGKREDAALPKRNVEMLGKRGREFLGKRDERSGLDQTDITR